MLSRLVRLSFYNLDGLVALPDLRSHDAAAWAEWLDTVVQSLLAGSPGITDAIAAAFTLPCSNSMVEGQIHQLKLIRRQKDGRTSFYLLRLRVLAQAQVSVLPRIRRSTTTLTKRS